MNKGRHDQTFLSKLLSYTAEIEDIYFEEEEDDDKASFRKGHESWPVILFFNSSNLYCCINNDKDLLPFGKNFSITPFARSLNIAHCVFRI